LIQVPAEACVPTLTQSCVLVPRFGVYGHFYTLGYPDARTVRCRSALEIITRQSGLAGELGPKGHRPDAIFIMMNPGSSRPVLGSQDPGDRHAWNDWHGAAQGGDLVETVPDPTQHQIMRIMAHRRWEHVRVLNLSDLRNPVSRQFLRLVHDLPTLDGGHPHSLFCPQRRTEREGKLLRKPGAPLIAAWGVDPRLKPLVASCLDALPLGEPLRGLLRPSTTCQYFHPRPPLPAGQRAWLLAMAELLDRELGEVQAAE
jgi:hypothetical protein